MAGRFPSQRENAAAIRRRALIEELALEQAYATETTAEVERLFTLGLHADAIRLLGELRDANAHILKLHRELDNHKEV